MLAIIPLSEKQSYKQREITITAQITLMPREFELLKLLSGNNLVTLQEISRKLYNCSEMTHNQKERVSQIVSKLRGIGFNITIRSRLGYRLTDDIFIK